MVDLGGEPNLRWLKWILGRKINLQGEEPSLVWTVRWTHDGSLPVEQIVSHRTSGTVLRWVSLYFAQLFANSCKCHAPQLWHTSAMHIFCQTELTKDCSFDHFDTLGCWSIFELNFKEFLVTAHNVCNLKCPCVLNVLELFNKIIAQIRSAIHTAATLLVSLVK